MLGIGIDGEAEQRELNDRNADDHAEGQAVALQLDEFLADDAEPARDREVVAHSMNLGDRFFAGAAHQMDEYVFESRLDLGPFSAGLLLQRTELALHLLDIV